MYNLLLFLQVQFTCLQLPRQHLHNIVKRERRVSVKHNSAESLDVPHESKAKAGKGDLGGTLFISEIFDMADGKDVFDIINILNYLSMFGNINVACKTNEDVTVQAIHHHCRDAATLS